MCICHVRTAHMGIVLIVFGFHRMSLALCCDVCIVILDYCWLKKLCIGMCVQLLGGWVGWSVVWGYCSFLGSNLFMYSI